MRFSCHKAELLQAVQVVSRVIPSQTSEPMFLNVLLEAAENGLTLSATQHQVSIQKTLEMKISEQGRTAVPGALLSEILQQLQTVRAEGIDFVLDADRISLSGEGAVYRLGAIDPASFPALQEPAEGKSLELDAPLLRDLIRKVVVVNSSGVGPNYDEVLLEVQGGTAAFVATDSVRLAVAKIAVSSETSDFDVRLPLSSLSELGKILPSEGSVKLTVGSHQVAFRFAGTVYVARTSDKTFPNYRAILPKDHTRYIVVESKGFADALKGVTPLARANKNRVRMEADAGRLKISCSSQEMGGDAERTVEAELTGDPVELSFNAKYVLDFLAAADSEKVKIGVSAATLPATFRPEEDGTDYVYLLMPINL